MQRHVNGYLGCHQFTELGIEARSYWKLLDSLQ